MNVVSFSDARRKLTEIVNEVVYAKKRFVLTRQRKEVAVLISIKDFEKLKALDQGENVQ